MKVMNYVYAAGVYVLINAALYGSDWGKATGHRRFMVEPVDSSIWARAPTRMCKLSH